MTLIPTKPSFTGVREVRQIYCRKADPYHPVCLRSGQGLSLQVSIAVAAGWVSGSELKGLGRELSSCWVMYPLGLTEKQGEGALQCGGKASGGIHLDFPAAVSPFEHH